MAQVLALVGDFFFKSKVREVSHQLGVSLQFLQDRHELSKALEPDTRWLLLDLDAERFEPIEAIREVKRLAPSIRSIGYCFHTHQELKQKALEAGCGIALTKNDFSRDLPRLLAP